MRRIALLAALLTAALAGGVGRSQAAFVAASANPGNSISTAADFNTVAVTLTDPGTPVRGTVALAAAAASDRGIESVTFETSPAGAGTWSYGCTSTVAPYGCSLDTSSTSDGLYDVRAVALDNAGYTRTSVVTGRRVDNGAPAASLTDPGSPLKGTIGLSATASDPGSGLASLTLQRKPAAGSTWTDVCTGATSPLGCSLDTTALADGLWDVRAVAVDAAGNTTTDTVTDRRVDNTAPTVTMAGPGAMLGTVTLSSATADGGSGVASVAYEYRTSPAGAWTAACTGASSPFSCSFATATRPNGLYDLRATATDAAGNATTSAVIPAVWIDNTTPATATMSNPGSPLSGSVTLDGTATDADSGIASLRFQYAPTGTTGWVDACADASAPYSCSWDTTVVADGVYDLRSLATDQAGGTRASTTVASRRVDNVVPAVTLNDPGTPLRGTRTLTATASDGGGVANVVMQYKLSSGSTWTTICTDASSPYSCSWNTTSLADGSYDLRATATDNAARTSTALVTGRVVDNTGPRASAVTSASGGTSGTLGAGDTLTLTYTESVLPATLVTGWNGASRNVSAFFARSGGNTTVAVTDVASGSAVPIGTLWFTGRFTNAQGATFSGTIALSGSVLTLTLAGTPTQGSTRTDTVPAAMSWTNTTAITDIAGNAGVATTVTGSGQL